MYFSHDELSFSLFQLLMPSALIGELCMETEEQAFESMLKCKSLFDMEILRSRDEKLAGEKIE